MSVSNQMFNAPKAMPSTRETAALAMPAGWIRPVEGEAPEAPQG
ncbi:MAG TPA: hypothetical protein VFY22_11190 [Hydrogenophaga sp.]|nr:hypothetical protein [Hydrogenophaga sp.]